MGYDEQKIKAALEAMAARCAPSAEDALSEAARRGLASTGPAPADVGVDMRAAVKARLGRRGPAVLRKALGHVGRPAVVVAHCRLPARSGRTPRRRPARRTRTATPATAADPYPLQTEIAAPAGAGMT